MTGVAVVRVGVAPTAGEEDEVKLATLLLSWFWPSGVVTRLLVLREFLAVTTPAMMPQIIPMKMISASAAQRFRFHHGRWSPDVGVGE